MGGIPLEIENTIQDLSDRWHRARQAAYKKVLETSKCEKDFLSNLNEIQEEKFEQILKLVFLNSRSLGLSYQKSKNLIWEQSDFVVHAAKLGSPCLQGIWETRTAARVLNRGGCAPGKKVGHRYCQYWREAIDGLVIGLSDEVGFVRSKSVTVGDVECVDIFFDEESSPTDAIWTNPNKWGALPGDIEQDLKSIQRKFNEMKIDLKFLGLSEKNLIYKLEPKENLTCGSAGAIYRTLLENLVKEKFPFYTLKDASPVAVYGERT